MLTPPPRWLHGDAAVRFLFELASTEVGSTPEPELLTPAVAGSTRDTSVGFLFELAATVGRADRKGTSADRAHGLVLQPWITEAESNSNAVRVENGTDARVTSPPLSEHSKLNIC